MEGWAEVADHRRRCLELVAKLTEERQHAVVALCVIGRRAGSKVSETMRVIWVSVRGAHGRTFGDVALAVPFAWNSPGICELSAISGTSWCPPV